MSLILQRPPLAKGVTIGTLSIEDHFQCITLEDEVREVAGWPVEDWKVSGQSAIPVGTYKLKMTFSNRFQKTLPQLMDVPGFTGIRIHPGNTTADTEGCILVGTTAKGTAITESRNAFEALVAKLGNAEHTIEIRGDVYQA